MQHDVLEHELNCLPRCLPFPPPFRQQVEGNTSTPEEEPAQKRGQKEAVGFLA